jgi:Fur family ferric uptake transcriptional regulator
MMARLTPTEREALLVRFRQHLRDRHLPVTAPRERVARALIEADEHLSAEDVERRLKEWGTPAGTATVYRTLDLLVRSGLARAHDFGEGFRRYEAMPAQSFHGHLVCLRCSRVLEFSNATLERIIPMIADEQQFQHQRHRIEIYGLCHDCRERDLAPLRG